MNSRPNIDVDASLRIDDAFADRLVEQMLIALDHDCRNLLDRLGRTRVSGNVGNPIAQRRHFDGICRELGSTLLGAGIRTGTRKRFWMGYDLWARGHRETSGWLVGARLEMLGTGPNHDIGYAVTPLAGFSHHALVRLVQRAGCGRPEDLVAMLDRAWGTVQMILHAREHSSFALPGIDHPGWVIPLAAISEGRSVYLVVKGGIGHRQPKLVVTTALTDKTGVVDKSAFDALMEIHDRHGADGSVMAKDPGLPAALEATSKASRRGRAA